MINPTFIDIDAETQRKQEGILAEEAAEMKARGWALGRTQGKTAGD